VKVDCEPVVLVVNRNADALAPKAIIRLDVTDQRVVRIADYVHCPWILPAAARVVSLNGREP
jgi:hypothetical protein